MKALEQYFDTAFAAPDGIQKLRELILTLAMQGKLVPQNPDDQPASELLKEIAVEKKRLVKEGKIKVSKPLLDIKAEEMPYELPNGWEWAPLGNIGEINPRNTLDDNKDAGFVPMPLIKSRYGSTHKFEVRKWVDIKKGYTHFANDDVGLAKITPCFENAKSCVFNNLPNGIGAGTTELHIFRNTFGIVYPEYLLAYLKNPKFITAGITKMTGSAGQKRVPTSYFTQNPFPLPPLAEQHRIVAKIDQLMARCDELETLRNERREKRTAVHAAALNRLMDAQAHDTFTDAWQFITRNFGDLYSVKENVAELRKAILQLAVMGKLVSQNPDDQPASELLKEIAAEKKRMVKEGKIKAPKSLQEIKAEEVPYQLPMGWEWVRLSEIADYNGRKNVNGSEISPDTWVLDLEDIEKSTSRLISRAMFFERQSKSTKSAFQKGDILYGKLRPYLDKVLVADLDGVCTTEIVPIVPFSGIYSEFLRWLLKCPRYLEYVNSLMYGVKMPRLGTDDAINSIHPLPPLAEQYRIVAKIDQLMTLCDSLEQQIDAAAEKQTSLLNAVMAQV